MLSNILLYTDCFIEPNAWYSLFIAISQNTASFVITLPGGREVEDSQWTTHCPLRVGVGLNGLLIDQHELVGDEFFLSLVSAAIARNIAPFVVILSSGGEGWRFIMYCPWWPVVALHLWEKFVRSWTVDSWHEIPMQLLKYCTFFGEAFR